MDQPIKKLIKAVKEKRESKGYSLRRLSEITGVSFSTLSRIERFAGEPDNNTKIRLLNWLTQEHTPSGMESSSFKPETLGFEHEKIVEVHFRAVKEIDSKTVEHLAQVAKLVKAQFSKDEK